MIEERTLAMEPGEYSYAKYPKRKRVTSATQRVAANFRERKRMNNLNNAFAKLRSAVPGKATSKR